MPVKVVIVGAAGRMGQAAVRCLSNDLRFEIAGLVGRVPSFSTISQKPIEDDLRSVLERERPDVLLELTTGVTASANALQALVRSIPVVIGATGIAKVELEELEREAAKTSCLLVPNFAIGAVLMMKFSEMAAKWLPDAEIIELHHEKKVDAPSGTAMRTAEMISQARATAPTQLAPSILKAEGARGATVHEVNIHSVRLRGLLAHQEVIFGGQGEALTIRHDSLDRSSFDAGILLSCEKVQTLRGFNVGLEALL
jgi:4-hydroxy-tetrahydrodipicolinate reductase